MSRAAWRSDFLLFLVIWCSVWDVYMTVRVFCAPVCLVTLYIFINTGFVFEGHIGPTPCAVGAGCGPGLAATAVFVKGVGVFLQVRYGDRPSLTTSGSAVESRFVRLLLVLLLGGQVELDPGPVAPNRSSALGAGYPCGVYRRGWMTVTVRSCVIDVNYGFILIAWCFLFQIIQLY